MTMTSRKRTSVFAPLTAAAAENRLVLQHCPACGHVQYPPRSVCGNCLDGTPEWRESDGSGRVLSWTVLHFSLEARFTDELPLRVVLVELDAGPVLYAFAEDDLMSNDRVRVAARLDADGHGILYARKV